MPDEITPPVKPPEGDTGAADRSTGEGLTKLDSATLAQLLKETRSEAASYRTKFQEEKRQREEMASYVKPEDHTAVVAELAQLKAAAEIAALAAEHSLPESFAKRITGATPEERKADAEALAKELETLGASGGGIRVGRGGLDPSSAPTSTDPRSLAAGVRRSRS